jgi:hypothetical protein
MSGFSHPAPKSEMQERTLQLNKRANVTCGGAMVGNQGLRATAIARCGSTLAVSLSHFSVRDFAQCHHNLAVIGVDQGLGSFEELPRPLRGQHDKFESIVYFLQAIFYRDS